MLVADKSEPTCRIVGRCGAGKSNACPRGCPPRRKFGPPCNVPLWDALRTNVTHPDTVLPYLLTSRDGHANDAELL
eukprot:2471145-Amphidinium_carterae.1